MQSTIRLMYALWVLVAAAAQAVDLSTTSQLRDDKPPQGIAPTPCCGAAIVPAGNFEVEANYSGDGVRGNFVHTSNLTLKYSLTDRIQLQLGTNNFVVGGASRPTHAFDGVSPGLKVVVVEERGHLPQFAFSVHGVFPTLALEGALQATVDAIGMIYASKNFGPLHLDATLSVTFADLLGAPAAQGGAALTATWNFTDQWGLATGPYSSYGNAERLGVDGGWFAAVNLSPIPELALSAGLEAGFFQDTRAFSVFAGVAWVPTAHAKFPLAQNPQLTRPLVATHGGSPGVPSSGTGG